MTAQKEKQRHGTWPHLVSDYDAEGRRQAMIYMGSNEFSLETLMEAAGPSEIRDSRDPWARCAASSPPKGGSPSHRALRKAGTASWKWTYLQTSIKPSGNA